MNYSTRGRLVPCTRSKHHGHYVEGTECPDCGPQTVQILSSVCLAAEAAALANNPKKTAGEKYYEDLLGYGLIPRGSAPWVLLRNSSKSIFQKDALDRGYTDD